MFALTCLLFACGDNEPKPKETVEKTAPKAPIKAPDPVRQPLDGEALPALFVSQAWFYKGEDGKPRPGPARLEIWRKTKDQWSMSRLEDGASNVFHKAMPYDNGILTIGAEAALLKKWVFNTEAHPLPTYPN